MRERGHFKRGTQPTVPASVPTRRAAAPKVVDGMIASDPLTLDRAIEQLSADLVVLRRAKEIMASYASHTANDEAVC